ncbi:MAG TPA: hypothetical protein VG320_17280 [Paraburkholderia sp.]|jgi:hypothetical protein|uniref:hypothetical protein n=1 Tax=Paraburkholderia sp. TaxID=1926495 RepID=UPI002DE49A35|nr:hypothetical protein [Paraburkholderia sp.]
MTAPFLKRAALCVSVFVVVWIVALVWWSSTRQIPGVAHVFGYLFALPVAIICGAILALRARAGSQTAIVPRADTPPPKVGEKQDSPDTQHLRAAIAHIAVRSAQGSSGVAIDSALTEGARAPLDTRLKDDQGFPVRAARVATLHDEDLAALREVWQAQYRDVPLADHTLRALALLEEVVFDTAGLLGHIALVDPLTGTDSRVQFDVIVDPRWDSALCVALAQHLQARIAQEWPHLLVGVTPVKGHTAASALAQLDLAIMALGHEAPEARTAHAARWHVVAATHSSLDDNTIAEALRAGYLFTPSNQNGEIAGESATAIALHAQTQDSTEPRRAPDETADDAADKAQTPIAIIARPALKPVDEPHAPASNAAGALLEATADRAMEFAGVAANAIGSVVADKGAQATHAVELALFAGSRFPDLEPLVDTLALDGGCGGTHAAGALLAVALAAHRAQTKGQPVLCTTLGDAAAQSAVVVLPLVPA